MISSLRTSSSAAMADCKALRIDSFDGWRTTPKCKLLILLAYSWLAALDDVRNWLIREAG